MIDREKTRSRKDNILISIGEFKSLKGRKTSTLSDYSNDRNYCKQR